MQAAAPQPGAGAVGAKDVRLVHVAALFRHGDRTPLSRNVGDNLCISADEMQFWISRLADHTVIQKLNHGTRVVASEPDQQRGSREPEEPHHGGRWPCGQLTAKGIREMQANGQALRAKYAALIDGMDPRQHVYVLSTNVRRTIRSAQSVLCGMFPEFFESQQQQTNDEQFILVHADEHSRMAPSHSYELFGDLGLYLADELKQNAPPGIISTGKRIRDVVGIHSDRRISWTGLREVLIARREHGVPFPEGIDQELFDRIQEYDAWLWFTLYGKHDFCFNSFHGGVSQIYSHLKQLQEKRSPHKLTLFSGHDNSIVALIKALQLQTPPAIPRYGAMLIFELHEHRITGELFIKAVYDNREITFKGHEHSVLCPFAHMEALVHEFLRPRGPAAL